MIHDQILNEAFKLIYEQIGISIINKNTDRIIKLILENLILSAKIEILKEINERKE